MSLRATASATGFADAPCYVGGHIGPPLLRTAFGALRAACAEMCYWHPARR